MKVVFDHLTKEYESKKNVPGVIAVNDFCFEIPDGKLVGLLGPSGCGKSTCLNLICGLIEATSGKIYFGEQDVTKLPPEKRGVGMVFQNYALYPHLTVRQNIAFPLENLKGDKKLTKNQINEKVLEVAKLVQIDSLLSRKPAQLSGGQQQRVAIARSLVKMPNVLLLDEPLSNLDARLRLQTREQIRRIQKETGITTIFVTHDQEEAMSICDLVVLMKDGVINQIGKPQEIYDNPANLFVAKFLGTPAINVFEGKIENNSLYIGEDKLMDVKESDQDVYVAIRPEGFIVNPSGKFKCKFDRVQVMGRDTSLILHNDKCIFDEDIRAIISSDTKFEVIQNNISFDIKENKLFVFNKKEERICLKKTI